MPRMMVISDRFPYNHPKKGKPTYFPDMFLNGLAKYGVYTQEYVNEQLKRIYTNPLFRKNRDWVEDFYPMRNECKLHTIRIGQNKRIGEVLQPKLWLGQPRKQPGAINVCGPLEIKQIWNIKTEKIGNILSGTITGIFDALRFSVEIKPHIWEVDSGFNTPSNTAKQIYKTDSELFNKIIANDALNAIDFHNWFVPTKHRKFINEPKNFINNYYQFEGQIISFIDVDFYGLNTPNQTVINEIFDMRYDHNRNWQFIANVLGIPVQMAIDIHTHYSKYYLKHKVNELLNSGMSIANTAKSLRITEKEVLEIYDCKDEIKEFVESLDLKGFTNN